VPDLDSPTTKITFAMASILPEIPTQKFMSDSNFIPKVEKKFALSRRLLNRAKQTWVICFKIGRWLRFCDPVGPTPLLSAGTGNSTQRGDC